MSLQTYYACYPCLLRQAVEAVDFVGLDEENARDILNDTMRILIDVDGSLTSAEIAALIHQNIIKKVGGVDPYKQAKKDSFQSAMEFYEEAKEIVSKADDPLAAAIKVSTAGNIIDFGPTANFDLHKTLQTAFREPFAIFDYESFRERLKDAKHILFLADNAGETVFDRVLIEEMHRPLEYVVKKAPIMNDALYEDAEMTNMPDYVKIIDNGSAIQGTVLHRCSKEFLEKYKAADLIISKGMANYETLPEEKERTFFLLKIKCDSISRLAGIPAGSFVFQQGGLFLRQK